MRTGRRIAHDARNVHSCIGGCIVSVERATAFQIRRIEPVEKGRALTIAHAIVQLERGLRLRKPLGHAQQRRNPDAACEQHRMPGVVRKRKMIARPFDTQRISHLQCVHRAGTAARCSGVLHRDHVSVALLWTSA